MLIPDWIQLSLICSLIAIVWVHHLTGKMKLLSWMPDWFRDNITRNQKVNFMLFICPACLSGQLCFWFCLGHHIGIDIDLITCQDMDNEILSILLTMYTSTVLEKLMLR